MGNNKTAVGYSDGVAYNLIDYNIDNLMGLIELPEWIFPVWCLFEKIELL